MNTEGVVDAAPTAGSGDRSLLGALADRRNGLTRIRLILAGMVLVSHAWPVTTHRTSPTVGGENLGSLAVAAFFAISGYLITGSRLSLSLPRFAWHRFLRIFPGYWVVLLVTAFGFAPGVSALAGERWSPGAAMHYLAVNWTTRINDVAIEGTLLHSGTGQQAIAGSWNGSVWTLFYELICYLVVGLALVPRWTRRVPRVSRLPRVPRLPLVPPAAWAAGAVLVATSAGALMVDHIPWADVRAISRLGAMFAAGALLRLLGDRVPRSGILAVAAGLACLAAILMGQLYVLAPVPLAYLVLWIGAQWRASGGRPTGRSSRLTGRASRGVGPSSRGVGPASRGVDLSYGVYIYAYPVQQILVKLHVATGSLPLFVVTSAALVVPLAYLSWVVVERPSLQATSWAPSVAVRRVAHACRARGAVTGEEADAASAPTAVGESGGRPL